MSEDESIAKNQLHRSPDVLTRKSSEFTFLFNTATNELFRVNKTGGRIWELIDGRRTVDEIARIITQEFKNATFERVEKPLLEFLNKLSDRYLLQN